MGFLESWYEDNISGKDGKYKGRGFGAAILKPFVDEEAVEGRVQGTRNREAALGAGYDLNDLDVAPGAGTLEVQGAALRKKKDDKITEKKDDEKSTLTLLQAQQAPGLEESRATNRRLLEQGQQAHSLALMQMADNKDARAADLERERLRERKDDIRYNERMDQLDRKDRRMMQQTLAAGLASLGAAFAL